MDYEHTQHGYIHWMLMGPAVVMALAGAGLMATEPRAAWILLSAAAALAISGLMFGRLTVADEGHHLALRYGPLPVLGKRIRYSDITAVATDRTTFLDGWGIHWMPGRGMTYNLWGYDCVRLSVGRRTIRIGTDDPDGLAAFLQSKIGQAIGR